ncbi:hypothetical protein [Chitinophaga agri]|uniref:hypothetical protein n=1 Tax=Chitinophaga agri TaxID=2703787 RepID=UPI001EE4D9B3|nr:hypothetical protein [Chitinophaga agri]
MNVGIFICSCLTTLYSVIGVRYVEGYHERSDSVVQKINVLPDKYLAVVQHTSTRVEKLLDRRTDKLLRRLQKEEQRMKARLWKIDTAAANKVFNRSIDSLGHLRAICRYRRIDGPFMETGFPDNPGSMVIFPAYSSVLSKVSEEQLSTVMESIASLQSKFYHVDQLKAYIRWRKKELHEQLLKYHLFSKALKRMNKEVYYYSQQVHEYKQLFYDKERVVAKAMELVTRLPLYRDFIQRGGPIADLFYPGFTVNNTVDNLEGVQTRTQVAQLLEQQMGSAPTGGQFMNQQMEQARAQLQALKGKYPDLDNVEDMPGFKPNPMKTKRFLQRLTFGSDMQFQQTSRYFPATADLAGQVGYRFHKNGMAGIGASYTLGLGTGWDDIVISHQGVGVRSFLDWKLKEIFFVNGGFEGRYVQTIMHAGQLREWSGWQGSALLGIRKQYKISARLKGNVMLLYDFLAKRNTPPASPVKLRLGYSL